LQKIDIFEPVSVKFLCLSGIGAMVGACKSLQPGVEVCVSLSELPVGLVAAFHMVGYGPHLQHGYVEMCCCLEYGRSLHTFDVGRKPLHNLRDGKVIAMHRVYGNP